jgi:L-fuculose-phosphate aldolase
LGKGSVPGGDEVGLTPSGARGDTLIRGVPVACPLEQQAGREASRDGPLHLAGDRAQPGVGWVLHSHGPHAIALSLAAEALLA